MSLLLASSRTAALATGRARSREVTQTKEDSWPHLKWTDRFVTSAAAGTGNTMYSGQVALTLDGQLTLHGVTRPFTIPVKARWNGGTIDVIGTAPIVLGDYGTGAVMAVPGGWAMAKVLMRLPLPFVGEFPRLSRSLAVAYIWEQWPNTLPSGAEAPA